MRQSRLLAGAAASVLSLLAFTPIAPPLPSSDYEAKRQSRRPSRKGHFIARKRANLHSAEFDFSKLDPRRHLNSSPAKRAWRAERDAKRYARG